MDATPKTAERKVASLLVDKLASVLPKGFKFGVYHVSTPPTLRDPLYSPLPNQKPDRTYCESHFLAVSIDVTSSDGSVKPVLVLALEAFLYTTKYTTTLFVSKADSTGYLHLLGLPAGSTSPIRSISTAFIEYLIEERRRKNVQFVVSLFARAQDQYLFPGSVENKKKHVLDDKGLVKWWCRVINPIIEAPPLAANREAWKSIKAYLVVPGLDAYETRALVPRTAAAAYNWSFTHPLGILSQIRTKPGTELPPRCLIPMYPDDPKSRFRVELDEEAAKGAQYKNKGLWKSVHTIDQFWEMMAFRQECSSGRMTGFLWVVFDTLESRTDEADSEKVSPPLVLGLKPKTQKQKAKKKKKLTGIIPLREPHIKTHRKNNLLKKHALTAYYTWPLASRGDVIVDDADYKQIYELLLRLDFAKIDIAVSSSHRWIREVGGGKTWGTLVEGTAETPAAMAQTAEPNGLMVNKMVVNNLSGLVKRKRQVSGCETTPPVANVPSAELLRKKQKN
ncbi:hypothetical protein Cpir12675_004805 [Ceratocystis pirilliformis]|uniref:histone acetyltransferase n=1 Tax=Ceratocystis pirilliformis TaxID=259994 RepID=A0ABR3YUT8_9PEZI